MRGAALPTRDLLLLTHEFPPYPGGVARYCASVAAAAARAGIDVTVVAPDHPPNASGAAPDPPQMKIIRFPGDVFDIRHLRTLQATVAPLLNSRPWAIVHAADWPMIMAAGRHDMRGRCKIASLHGSDVMVLKNSWRARVRGSASRLEGFDRYVCNSRYTEQVLTGAFPKLSRQKVAVAPLGVDAVWFAPPAGEAHDDLVRLVDWNPTDLVVLTVARVDRRKGHLQTIRSLARLPRPLKARVKYVCIGLCADPALVRAMVAAAKLADVRLYVTGPLPMPQVRAAYSLATVFALTAEPMKRKIEGFGLVLLEAAAAGLPSVVTSVHAIPEVVNAGIGWIRRPHDFAALAVAFEESMTGSRRDQMRASCIAEARRFTWDACVELTYGGC